MILKYYKNGAWGYIDNVRQAAVKDLDIELLAEGYDSSPLQQSPDPCEYMNGVKLSDDIAKINKAFSMVCMDMADEGINRHAENLLEAAIINYPAIAVLVYLEDCKEYDAILLVTNGKAFLMNDKGQNIERLN